MNCSSLDGLEVSARATGNDGVQQVTRDRLKVPEADLFKLLFSLRKILRKNLVHLTQQGQDLLHSVAAGLI